MVSSTATAASPLFLFFFILITFSAPQVKALSTLSKSQKTALVTGSTDGIGLTTAKNLASKGYNVILHGRDPKRIDRASDIIRSFVDKNTNFEKSKPGKILTVHADISTVSGCRNLVSRVQSHLSAHSLSLDVLMNNAGVFEDQHQITPEDELEMTFAVNVMAPFVITSLLLPQLLSSSSSQSRIVIASSISQCSHIKPDQWDDLHCVKHRGYSTHRAYAESKLFDAMMSLEMAERLKNEGGYGTDRITCNSLDPGTVNTKMLLAGWGPCGIDVEDALDQTWLCTSEEVKDTTGEYFVWRSSRGKSYKESERSKLWSVLTGIAPDAASVWEKLPAIS